MKLFLIGCGNIGSILLDIWSRQNFFDQILVLQPSLLQAKHYKTFKHISFISSIENIPIEFKADIILLAIKPQIFEQVLTSIPGYLIDNSIIISMLAGIKISSFKSFVQNQQKIIRIMPNVAIKTAKSVNLAYANNNVTPKDIDLTNNVFNNSGPMTWLEREELIDLLTPISACGPAYFYLLAEVLVQYLIEIKIEEKKARDLVQQTLIGASSLITENNNFGQLINNVASKGGVTEAALKVLKPHFDEILPKALSEAQKRIRELDNENCH